MVRRPRAGKLVFLRHARSLRNALKSDVFVTPDIRDILSKYLEPEVPLGEGAYADAQRTGIFLRDHIGRPDRIIRSHYRRVIETTEGILEAYSPEERALIPVIEDERICERLQGENYGLTREEADLAHPGHQAYWERTGGWLAVPPGGHSLFTHAKIHLESFLEELNHPGETVFVVTHGGSIHGFRYLLEDLSDEEALALVNAGACNNCGITIYEWDEERGRLMPTIYNLTQHLESAMYL